MKTSTLVAILMALRITLPQVAQAVLPSAGELVAAHRWTAARFAGDDKATATTPFFSFTYGGRPSTDLLGRWELKRDEKKLDAERTQHTLTYTDPKTRLVVRCIGVEYRDFPTVEWTLYFKNTGDTDTPILEDIQAADLQMERPSAPGSSTEFRLHHNVGSPYTPQDYGLLETILPPGADKTVAGGDGRPTSANLCYFNIEQAPDRGLIVAVGWPGQCAARFTRDKENHLRIRAGQERTHFKLLPGEEVRSPLIAVQFWQGGDWLRAQNIWRRWFIAHNLRKPGGKLPPTQWCGTSETGTNLMCLATEANQKQYVDAYLQRGLKPELWWMDAGWYPCKRGSDINWWYTGTWEFDQARFPNGLRPVTDYLHSKGIRAILWFEPERVTVNSWLANHHPEWLFGGPKVGSDQNLLDLGNPDARRWVLEMVDRLVTESNLDIYRQDFNIGPLPYWRANDVPDRQGITEIRHVTGLLAFWDELLRRHPNLLFDVCASGGRRNDLESMRRGVPYCKTDYAADVVAVQGETYGISLWLPYFGATWDTREDAYSCRSRFAHLVGACLYLDKPDHFRTQLPKRLEEWRKAIQYYWSDFWPLTPYSIDNKAWIAWQFDCPEKGEGVVQAFRRAESDNQFARFRLRGLKPQSVYTLTNVDIAGSTEMMGRELLDSGLPVTMKDRPCATVIMYKRK
jgi:alpha-galactosidase